MFNEEGAREYRYMVIIVIRNPITGLEERIPVEINSDSPLSYSQIREYAENEQMRQNVTFEYFYPNDANRLTTVTDVVIISGIRRG